MTGGDTGSKEDRPVTDLPFVGHVIDGAEVPFDEGPWPRMTPDERGRIGREGGRYSREFFTEPKAVVMEI
jgi:hypothetical protein